MQSQDEDIQNTIKEINSLGGRILKKILESDYSPIEDSGSPSSTKATLVSVFPDAKEDRIDIFLGDSISTFYIPSEERSLFLQCRK